MPKPSHAVVQPKWISQLLEVVGGNWFVKAEPRWHPVRRHECRAEEHIQTSTPADVPHGLQHYDSLKVLSW